MKYICCDCRKPFDKAKIKHCFDGVIERDTYICPHCGSSDILEAIKNVNTRYVNTYDWMKANGG